MPTRNSDAPRVCECGHLDTEHGGKHECFAGNAVTGLCPCDRFRPVEPSAASHLASCALNFGGNKCTCRTSFAAGGDQVSLAWAAMRSHAARSTRWHCAIRVRDEAGKSRLWNVTLDAHNAVDAMDHALAPYDPDRVDAVEVERV